MVVEASEAPRAAGERPRLALPGVMIGMGLGGFVDGILLHQILQWHHMLSNTGNDNVGIGRVPVDTVNGLEIHTLWDGLFHAVTWAAVLVGLGLLSSRIRRARVRQWSSRVLWGWTLVGWGVFNLVEGLVNHHVLAIHHVRSGPHQLWWDLGFLAVGGSLVVGGWLLQRSQARH